MLVFPYLKINQVTFYKDDVINEMVPLIKFSYPKVVINPKFI